MFGSYIVIRVSPTGRAANNGGADIPFAISTTRSPIIMDIDKLATKVWLLRLEVVVRYEEFGHYK